MDRNQLSEKVKSMVDLGLRFDSNLTFRDHISDSDSYQVGGVAQWWNVGLWPANFPCPALDLQLMGDH